jgi:hypothetical protein
LFNAYFSLSLNALDPAAIADARPAVIPGITLGKLSGIRSIGVIHDNKIKRI